MGLVVVGIIAGGVRPDIKCLHVVAIDDTGEFVRIVLAVGLHWCLSVEGLDARVRQFTSVGDQRLYVFLNFQPFS